MSNEDITRNTPKRRLVRRIMSRIPKAYTKTSTVYLDVAAGLHKMSMHELEQLNVMLISGGFEEKPEQL